VRNTLAGGSIIEFQLVFCIVCRDIMDSFLTCRLTRQFKVAR
jgi:hypothetical protein